MSHSSLLQTPLHAWHVAHGGRMVDFGGWSMPVQYTSIVAEHQATRRQIGLFDVSHMGRFRLDGPHAGSFLDRVLTRRISDLPAGRVRYALVTRQDGGTLDDVLAYHLLDLEDQPYYALVVNAGNRQKIWDWLHQQQPQRDQVVLTDQTRLTAMIAVQGPQAVLHCNELLQQDLSGWKNYSAAELVWRGQRVMISRTGYTGEDGLEWTVPVRYATEIWETLLGDDGPAVPVGLGARDTLRLEAAMPLYGHELTDEIDPLTAGLDFAVDLDRREFPGHAALQQIRAQGPQRQRVGWLVEGKRIAREGSPVLAGQQQVGVVTSGTLSPTLDRPIAMGYLQTAPLPDAPLQVDIRGRRVDVALTGLPFYKRST